MPQLARSQSEVSKIKALAKAKAKAKAKGKAKGAAAQGEAEESDDENVPSSAARFSKVLDPRGSSPQIGELRTPR